MYRNILLLITLSLTIAGSSHEQSRNLALQKAQNVVDANPDSAVRILSAIVPDSLNDESEVALYELLMAESLHRIGVDVMSDSTIRHAREYFSRHGNKENAVRAMLYHGIIQYDSHQVLEAVTTIKQAEEAAKGLNNDFIAYDINATLARINDRADNKATALRYYGKALSSAKECRNVEWMAMTLVNIADIYERSNHPKEARHYMELCEPLLEVVSQRVQARIFTGMAGVRWHDGRQEEAKQLLLRAMEIDPQEKTYKLLADIYAAANDWSKAVELWYQSLYDYTPGVQTSAYKNLISYFEKQHDETRALDLSKRLNTLYEKELSNADDANIADIQANFDQQMAEKTSYRRIITLLSAIVLLCLIVLMLTYYHRWRMRRYNDIIQNKDRKIQELNARYAEDLQSYTQMRAELASLQHESENNQMLIRQKLGEIELLQQRLSTYQDDRQKPDDWNLNDNLLTADILFRLHQKAATGRMATAEEWSELHQVCQQYHPALLALLHQKNLNMREQNTSLLIRLRFIPSEVATLTGATPQSVTNLRVRLLQKMFDRNGGAKDFDSQIRAL